MSAAVPFFRKRGILTRWQGKTDADREFDRMMTQARRCQEGQK